MFRRPLPHHDALALVVILCLQALWGAWFIFRSSLVLGDERVFCLFDDAMISMTYARNWVEGFGLTWSRAAEPPVEGFTTPLWTVLMAPFQIGPLRFRSLGVQVLSLLLLLALTVLVWKLIRDVFRSRGWPAALLTAFYYPLAYWGLMGMETALQAVLVVLAVWLASGIALDERRWEWGLGAVLALGYLTRMDMLLLAAVALAWITWLRGPGWLARRGFRSLLCLGVAAGGYQIFRQLYFGAPLPNTYYLKLTGIPLDERLARGLASAVSFLRAHLLPLLLVGAGVAPRLGKRSPYVLPTALVLIYAAYSVWVGGDAWDSHVRANRFVVFVLPLVFAMTGGLLAQLTETRPSLPRRQAVIAATATLLLLFNGLVLTDDAEENWRTWASVRRPMLVTSHHVVLEDLRRLQVLVRPAARVATVWAGIPAYFSDYRMVDGVGYNDVHTARVPARIHLAQPDPLERYVPGHAKWDHGYLLGESRPDIVFQLWGEPPDRQATLLRRHGYVPLGKFWIKRESRSLLWEESEKGRAGGERTDAPEGGS